MKKFLICLSVLFFALPAFAQLEQGQHIISGNLGLGFQLNNSGIQYSTGGSKLDWGSLGLDYGVNYHYLLDSHFGIGAEISGGDYDGANLTFSNSDEVNDSVHLFKAMLAARFNVNPDSRFRFYIPFGAGLVSAKQDMDVNYSGTKYSNKKTDNSFGWFLGAGLEFDVGTDGWSWGLESRYNAFNYDTDKLVKDAPAPIQGGGKRKYDYMNFMLKISKRF